MQSVQHVRASTLLCTELRQVYLKLYSLGGQFLFKLLSLRMQLLSEANIGIPQRCGYVSCMPLLQGPPEGGCCSICSCTLCIQRIAKGLSFRPGISQRCLPLPAQLLCLLTPAEPYVYSDFSLLMISVAECISV